MSTNAWAILFACLVCLSCAAAEPDGTGAGFGTAPFGSPCIKTEDCTSGLCVRVDDARGVCSRTCTGSSECPSSSNWGCVQADNAPAQVCACVASASEESCGDGVDNECNGLVDDCQLCNGKPVPKDDPLNCGACGVSCRSDQICTFGDCSCPPMMPFECAGKCVDLDVDSQNCGSCGTTCEAGQSCQNGVCACEDAAASDYCAGAGCVDLDTDATHCGSCDTACAIGLVCVEGACECPSSTERDHCPGDGCVDLQSDVSNCGGCGKSCPNGASCVAGKCACPPGAQHACGSSCVNLTSDPNNCGSCGKSCPAGLACSNGTCGCPGSAPNLCGGACVDLSSDEQHCGTCGNGCPADKACANGSCSCPISLPNGCGTTCTNFSNDEQNCGACGNVCPQTQTCQQGVCKCSSLGQVPCNGQCVSLSSNPSHCGACGNVCPVGQTCSSGACKCPTTGFSPCGASCVNLSTDPNNCGSCGNVCPAAQTCSAGTCKCPTGQTYCAQLGACIDTKSNVAHCGSCGNACQAGEICTNGICACLSSTEDWCASTGVCTPVVSNPSHCGACDNACPAGTSCLNTSCKCNQPGQVLCGTTCHDLSTDPDHCGSCTNACTGNHACVAGKCECPPPIFGSEVRLTTTTLHEASPAIAWNGTHLGVLYMQGPLSSGGNLIQPDLYLALLNPDGTRASTSDVLVDTNVRYSDMVWTGTEFGLVWTSGPYTYFQRFTGAGAPKAPFVNISTATPGTLKLGNDPPRIAWSPTYGGYALAAPSYQEILFQRIGADGTAPEPINPSNATTYDTPVALASSPAGDWGLAGRQSSSTLLLFYNADGSHTKPNVTIASSAGPFDIIHDGVTWTAALASASDIRLNRGEIFKTFTAVFGSFTEGGHVGLSMLGNGVLALKYKDTQYRLRRYTVPSNPTFSNYTLVGSTVTLVSTNSAVDLVVEPTGTSQMLAVWQDVRWGVPNAELYAMALDFQGCP